MADAIEDMTSFTADDLIGLSKEEAAAVERMQSEDRGEEQTPEPPEPEAPKEDLPPEEEAEAADGEADKTPPEPEKPAAAPEAPAEKTAEAPEETDPEPEAEQAQPEPLPDMTQFQKLREKAEAEIEAAQQAYDDMEMSREDWRAKQRELTQELTRIGVQEAQAQAKHDAARQAADDAWFGLVRKKFEEQPALTEPQHQHRFDAMLRHVESTRPDLTDEQKIDQAFFQYVQAANAAGLPLAVRRADGDTRGGQAEAPKAAAPEAPKPQRPAPPQREAPPTLAKVPSEAGNGEFGGEFGDILELTEMGRVHDAEARMATMSDAEFERLGRQLSGG